MTTPTFIDPLPEAAPPIPLQPIAGFWRRLTSFVIDVALFWVATALFAIPLFDQLTRLGKWGPVLGFFLALPYFALMNSQTGNGQTLGKRIMQLQVVDANGKTIPFSRSLLRYLVFSLPFVLGDLHLSVTRTPSSVLYLISFISTCVCVPTLYLLACNRATRQGLHDLAAKSYVVYGTQSSPVNVGRFWKGHWIVICILFVGALLAAVTLTRGISKWVDMPALMSDLQRVEAIDGVQSGSIMEGKQWSNGKLAGTSYNISVSFSGSAEQCEPLADAIAAEVLTHDRQIHNRDRLNIVVVRGYDLGLASSWVTRKYSYTPSEWDGKLGLTSVPSGDPASQ